MCRWFLQSCAPNSILHFHILHNFFTEHFACKQLVKIITSINSYNHSESLDYSNFANIIRSKQPRTFWRSWWSFSLLEIKFHLEYNKLYTNHQLGLSSVREQCELFCRTMYITMPISNVNKHRMLLEMNKW